MDIRIQSALLASIIGFSLSISMLLRAGRPRVLTLYSLFAAAVSGFYLTQFFQGLFGIPTEHPWLERTVHGAAYVIGSLTPYTAVRFFIEFLGPRPNSFRFGRPLAFLAAIVGFTVGVTPLIELPGAQYSTFAVIVAGLIIPVALLLRRMAQSDSRIERARLRYLLIGAAASIAFVGLDYLSYFKVPFPTLSPLVSTLYLFFLAQTLLRLRLMDLHELLGKVVSHTVLASILAVVFVILTAWVKNNLSLFLFNTIVAAFVMLILLEPLRVKVEQRVVAIFFRERFELLRVLTALRSRSANVIEVGDLAGLILTAFSETRRITHASIYLLAEDRPGYRLLDFRGPQPSAFLDAAAARHLLAVASGGQKAVLVENVERRIAQIRIQGAEGKKGREEIRRLNEIRASMTQMKAGISIPLLGNDRVLGFLNLWDERVAEAYASDEITMILENAERLATVVENSKLYDKMRERDRLAALGEMSAGLAHEIRNPLGAIKGAAQCLDPKRLPGEDGEFLEVIVEEVNRLNGVVTAFLDYARPLKQNFGPTDMAEVITRTIRLIQNEIPPTITLKTELSEGLNRINADAEQLKQVLINLIQNAIQALENKTGNIVVSALKADRFSDFRAMGEMVEIQVSDDGPGIPNDQQLNIFVPFFTTKQKGTGLGLAICQRIVKNHIGTVSVLSKVGEGTTFVIRLPALPPENPVETPSPEGTPYPSTLLAEIETTKDVLTEAPASRRDRNRKRVDSKLT